MQKKVLKATKRGNINDLKDLLQRGGNINGYFNGWTPLTMAAKNKNLKMVKCLIENGDDPNMQNNYCMTALMYASKYGYFKIVKFLVKNGADPNVKGNYRSTALMYASEEGKFEIAKCLVENGANPNEKDING